MTYHTEKREELLSFFEVAGDRAFSLEEICAALAPDGHGKSTLYRLTSKLVAEGTLKKIADGASRHCVYQFVGGEDCGEHLHLKCRTCERLIHLDAETTRRLKEQILFVGDFNLDAAELLLGECAECQRKRKRKKR